MEKTEQVKKGKVKQIWADLDDAGWHPFAWVLAIMLGVSGAVKFGFQHGYVMFMLGALLGVALAISEKLNK